MVYNNLFNRLLFSILLLVLYVFSLLNFYFLATFGILIYTIIFFETFKFFKKNTVIIHLFWKNRIAIKLANKIKTIENKEY